VGMEGEETGVREKFVEVLRRSDTVGLRGRREGEEVGEGERSWEREVWDDNEFVRDMGESYAWVVLAN
jgi:hypothetical protein